MKEQQWFKKFDCEKMQIIKYQSASSNKIEKQVTITDADYIKSFQYEINRLPTSGDMMIEMGPDVNYLTLEFSCHNEKETLQFYNSQIKTPATSFYIKNESPDRNIWKEIQLHFEKPEINKAIPKVKNMTYTFDDFSIEFLGNEDRTPKGTTASLFVESFKVVTTKDKHEQTVEVSSGQLPPRPEKFKVNNKNLVINTFVGKDGKRLDSRMFIVYQD